MFLICNAKKYNLRQLKPIYGDAIFSQCFSVMLVCWWLCYCILNIPYGGARKMKIRRYQKKSSIQKTLNLLTCADRRTITKADRNRNKSQLQSQRTKDYLTQSVILSPILCLLCLLNNFLIVTQLCPTERQLGNQ